MAPKRRSKIDPKTRLLGVDFGVICNGFDGEVQVVDFIIIIIVVIIDRAVELEWIGSAIMSDFLTNIYENVLKYV